MKTPVHINADGSLVVLPNYLQRKFGTWKTPGVQGACLLMQLGSLYNRQLKVGHQRIQEALLSFARKHGSLPCSGLPLVDSLAAFEHLSPWRMTGCVPHTTKTVVKSLVSGTPVMLVVDSAMIDGARRYDPVTRINRYGDRMSLYGGYNHCLLVIGYDYTEQQLIVRESRSNYTSFNGLTKIKVDELDRWKEGWKMFEPVFQRC